MGKLITIVGNVGSGKTTLTRKLCEAGPFCALLEQHKERPFQEQFSNELKRFSLSNQIDYLLFRAEQETYARRNDMISVQDGGLDQDFYVFTRLFHQKGYLDDEEFQLCERLHSMLRQILPSPDLIIKLSAPKTILVNRRANRKRKLDIVVSEDLDELEILIRDWVTTIVSSPVIYLDASKDEPSYESLLGDLISQINSALKDP